MRDELIGKAKLNECLILNIDHSSNVGTHWTCLFVDNGEAYYFDSFGYPPPLEVIDYCNSGKNNTFKIQEEEEVICGHYSIYMLHRLNCGFKFYDILDELYRYKN
jgi:hypothetical protein